ncbi:MAG: lipid-A-disaccharide synthase [Paludibacteraceae bacterium]
MRYFLIAGEASGDLHASNLMNEIKKLDSKAEFCFLGGDLMSAQGGTQVKHYREMAFMGIIAVLKNAKTVLNNIRECKKAIAQFRPDVVILIDYPSFNLQIAKFVKRKLENTPVYYYISPKIWAWKEFRIREIKKYIDKMYTILPFETEFYKKHHYEVTYVGNPTVDSITARPNQNQTHREFCQKNNLSDQPIIALLAGSRKQEITSCLPTMICATKQFADYQIIVAGAPGIDREYYSQVVSVKQFTVVFDQTYDLLAQAQAAVVNSGTATLETALIATPQVVVYGVAFGRIAIALKDIFIKVKYVSLVNLIAGKEVVKELIAHHFTEKNVAKELDDLLHNSYKRDRMRTEYKSVADKLGKCGTAKRAASEIVKSLDEYKKQKLLTQSK